MRIASFNVDHKKLEPGIYVSRVDDNVTSLDLRFLKPNGGVYLSSTQMHTIEHLMAHYLRNSSLSDCIVYFGPGGCRTMFYLLYFNSKCTLSVLFDCIRKCLQESLEHTGDIPGQSEQECGNYLDLDLEVSRPILERFLNLVSSWEPSMTKYEAMNE